MKKTTLLLCSAAAVLLAACGGGSDETPAPPAATDSVPTSASQSVPGLMSYLLALTVIAAEDKESLDVSSFSPPQPDDTEPETMK
jgi:ABC-type glycerol-3-phosphate transport system substrate-binding protein